MQIAPMPNQQFRIDLACLMICDCVFVFIWERLCRNIFKPKINQIIPVDYPSKKVLDKARLNFMMRIKKEEDEKKKHKKSVSP